MTQRSSRHHLPPPEPWPTIVRTAPALEHDAVIEAAVVASPGPLRGAVPKAFIC